MSKGLVTNFYRFFPIEDVAAEQSRLANFCENLGLLGTILIAHEGLNGGLFGSNAQLQQFKEWLLSDPRYQDTVFKDSDAEQPPFRKLSIKVKTSILSLDSGMTLTPEEINAGPRVSASEFRQALLNPNDDVVIVDTRNKYEIDYGAFRGARHLNIRSFKNFVRDFEANFGQARDKTYLMYCTGGIRCEKAVAALQKIGFKGAKQLDGGIISYFKEYGDDCYDGSCFVFDDRWAITPKLKPADLPPHPEQIPRKMRQDKKNALT